MGRVYVLAALLLATLAGCAAPRAPGGLAMPAPDEAGAATLLAGYLLARGWTVRLAEPRLVEATRDREMLRLEPLLDHTGLDRILVSRRWPADPHAAPADLAEFAAELNRTLNVGQFRAAPGVLELQSSLPFLVELEPRLLDAFVEFTAEVRSAVLQVQGNRTLLAPLEHDSTSR